MDKKRRILYNETLIEIKRLKKLNTNDSDTINRFRYKVGEIEYNKEQIDKINDNIYKRNDKINQLENPIISSG